MSHPTLITEGQKFGRWTVLTILPPEYKLSGRIEHPIWCKCECGIERAVLKKHLISHKSLSCGCIVNRLRPSDPFNRGKSKSKEYNIWRNMVSRCINSTNNRYGDYGGRGITVCPEWMIFENFILDMGMKPHSTSTLERIDNEKGYHKDNCTWVGRKTQGRNKRSNIRRYWNGQVRTLIEIAEMQNVNYKTLWYQVRTCNRSVEEALQRIRSPESQALPHLH